MYIIACRTHFCHLSGLGQVLPKGNQWEWWGPGQGPLPGLGEVGHSPRGTSGSDGTLDWAQCGQAPSPPTTPMPPTPHANPKCCLHPCQPQCPYTPVSPQCPTPLLAPMPLIHPNTLMAPEPLHSLSAPMHPWHPLQPCWPPMPLIPLHPASGSAGTLDWGPMWLGYQSICHLPMPPDTHYTPCWPLTPLPAPQCPHPTTSTGI